MELKNVVPWGRSLAEYIDIFALTEIDLKKSILGCGDGPASFNAELTKNGGNIISVDPTYRFTEAGLKKRISEVYDEVMPQMHDNMDKYIWGSISSPEELGRTRMSAMLTFVSDFELGKESGRYIDGSLPKLSFEDQQFDLALCSHYLFLYSEHVGLKEHIASINELCRVAKEVRIFPLLSLDGDKSVHLKTVISSLEDAGFSALMIDVKYRFQKGATQMLVVKSVA